MSDALTWFEIPSTDINRAQKFYEEVLQVKLFDPKTPYPARIFPAPEPDVKGAVTVRENREPADKGTIIFLRLNGDVDAAIERVKAAGGEIVVPKYRVPNVPGEMFALKDTEGNVVGVHAL